jgi:hypothetical protein
VAKSQNFQMFQEMEKVSSNQKVFFVAELILFVISIFAFVVGKLFRLQMCKHNFLARILGPQYLTMRQIDSLIVSHEQKRGKLF